MFPVGDGAGRNVNGCGNEWQNAPGFCARRFLAMFTP
jgi:hypothetical protein